MVQIIRYKQETMQTYKKFKLNCFIKLSDSKVLPYKKIRNCHKVTFLNVLIYMNLKFF